MELDDYYLSPEVISKLIEASMGDLTSRIVTSNFRVFRHEFKPLEPEKPLIEVKKVRGAVEYEEENNESKYFRPSWHNSSISFDFTYDNLIIGIDSGREQISEISKDSDTRIVPKTRKIQLDDEDE